MPSPTRITETYGAYAISIMETAVRAVDDYQERTYIFLTRQYISWTKYRKALNTPYKLKVVMIITARYIADN